MSTFYNNKSIIDLYTKIPDYKEVKHLGNAEFINKIEKLKEEFRQIRSSLYEDSDHDNEVESLVETTQKLNVNTQKPHSNLETATNYNQAFSKKYDNNSTYLSINGCQLYRPSEGRPSRPNTTETLRKYGSTIQLNRNNSFSPDDSGHSSQETPSDSANISRWSSSPDLTKSHFNQYVPPNNTEARLALRKNCNKRLLKGATTIQNDNKQLSEKVHTVPNHVTKPLFYRIMLKNKRRSDKVKQQSKQRLMAQVKPFFLSKSSTERGIQLRDDPYKDILNNERPFTKSKKHNLQQNINNKFGSSNIFMAKPAPPRRKALMAALRLKEQQEYRELKKRLRAEALMKLSTLPPSMEARHQFDKFNKDKLEGLLRRLQQERSEKHGPRLAKGNGRDTNETISDEERFSESPLPSDNEQPSTSKHFRKQRLSKSNNAIDSFMQKDRNRLFESTSNDNHASRLRVEAAKRKEEARLRREEEEQLRLMKIEQKRNKLKDWHINVWRRACSYSSNQDIAMRKQLREAASIVEKDTFKKDMLNMLTRVRSAPLLLEGVRERKFEPCSKHKQEMLQLSGRSSKFNTPRLGFGKDKYFSRMNWTSLGDDGKLNMGVPDKSETVALAEGSVTTSDNESLNDDNQHEVEEELGREENWNVENDEAAEIEKEVDEIINGETTE